MYITQAINNINRSLMETKGINLTYCVCDNEKFNTIVFAYRTRKITLDEATVQIVSTIIEHKGEQV
ncbi:hypothetical protein D6U78_10930 [Vibrio cholerae]|uniref:Uncharacterized protein n=1 Tax=Vibrio cholerae TaxID=666 RepID=A0ABD7SRJ2_VIBCL|nr:hypothetical protein DN30_503 [Vibrio cholerae]MVF55407.1 hypothetical protein [Vibrio cholerae]TXX67418.1 hypothetical protein FXF03_02225 [Vibrio cholerae]TXY44184.1 hypothetical protein FXE84_02220 [Vibrio cholerae]GIB00137.1 hypothetical protein VCSRO136_2523 [Vibrio cholerae]